MKTIEIICIIIWSIVLIEIIIVSIKVFRKKYLNHLPTFNYPLEDVCFEINNIKQVMFNVVEYTAVISFFKKPHSKGFVYNEYRFYDRKDKYNIGDKLYLNKK